MILLQDDCGALLFRERRHRFSDRAAELVPRHHVFDRLSGGGFSRELDDVDAFWGLGDRSAALAPDPVATEVQRDAIEPG